jgi:hypothetical protein
MSSLHCSRSATGRGVPLLSACIIALGCAGEELPVEATAEPSFADARSPTVEVFPIEDLFELDCGGFTARLTYTGTGRATTFFDGTGAPVKLVIHVKVKGSATNLSTGKTLKDDESTIIRIDLLTGETTINGGVAHVTAPGEGIVIHDTGKIVFDSEGNVTFVAGPHDQAEQGPEQAYCSALD